MFAIKTAAIKPICLRWAAGSMQSCPEQQHVTHSWDNDRACHCETLVSSLAGVNFNLDQCSPNGTDPYKPKCPESNKDKRPVFPEWLTVILLCLYLLFTNILLLNLLIAMFK